MKKKVYTKPSFQFVKIEWNDLCAGSNANCTTIDLRVIGINKQKDKTFTFGRGATKDMWETNF